MKNLVQEEKIAIQYINKYYCVYGKRHVHTENIDHNIFSQCATTKMRTYPKLKPNLYVDITDFTIQANSF